MRFAIRTLLNLVFGVGLATLAAAATDDAPVLVPASGYTGSTSSRQSSSYSYEKYSPRKTVSNGTAAVATTPDIPDATMTTGAGPARAAAAVNVPAYNGGRVKNGVDMLLERYLYLLRGKRVGLVTNHTGVNSQRRPTVDLLARTPGVRLTALFAPEHGIRGTIPAGVNFKNDRDRATGLPVFSLYGGKDHKPPKEGLAMIDVMVYSIQDVGSRAYTYVWHMAECMAACAAAGKPFIVLDCPNPLGAEVVDGPVTEPQYISFIGLYPVPRVYGMTVGELARYINTEFRLNAKLTVVPMQNYRRGMSWEQTGLPWIPTSPNIPTPAAAVGFACTGILGETGQVNIGIGYPPNQFQIMAAPWLNSRQTAAALNRLRLSGVQFQPVDFTAGSRYSYHGVRIVVTNLAVFRPTATEVAMLWYLNRYYPGQFRWLSANSAKFDKAMGTASVRQMLQSGASWETIVRSWQPKLSAFEAKRRAYLLYK